MFAIFMYNSVVVVRNDWEKCHVCCFQVIFVGSFEEFPRFEKSRGSILFDEFIHLFGSFF